MSKRLLGHSDLAQGGFPASLQFRGDETIVGVDTVELAFGQRGGIALALELPLRTGSQRGIHLLLSSVSPRQSIELSRRQGRQEGIRHNRVYASGTDILAGRQTLVGVQMIAYILSAALVADVHLVAASRAPGNAVQQKIAVARSASCLGTHVFGPVVFYYATDHFISRPVDVGWIPTLHDNPSFLDWPWHFRP
nr:hypothetical protein [uncultured Rhodopila sp.]